MKTAIVTGGSKGIGLAVVRMLVGRGYRVAATYAHDVDVANAVGRELDGGAVFYRCDHSVREQTYAFIDSVKRDFAGIDCIVCNAGITVRKSFLETTDIDWDSMMEVGVNSHTILLRELMPMINAGARIVFTGSAMGVYPHATVFGYGVVKSAVHGMVRNLVKVFEPLQVTVNAIAPGFVETEWQQQKPADVRERICAKTAIHRFCEPDEVARAFAFCLDNEFVNGAVINYDGGYSYM